MVVLFELKVYSGKRTDGEPEYEATGTGEEWVNYTSLAIPGFDGSYKLSLEEFWRHALENRLEYYEQHLVGYETIVKFGDTMQLKEPFTATLKVDYQ